MSSGGAGTAGEWDEATLLRMLREEDAGAYEYLVRVHTPRMLAVARRFLRVEDDAQDAVQDAFLSAFKAIDRFEGEARVSTWLHRIVVNACLMKLRTRRRKPEESIEELLPSFQADGHLATPATGWRDTAENLLERSESRVLVREAITRLPDPYRTVLLLRDIEGYDTAQTGEALGLSTGAVKTRLHRARLALRTLLDRHFRSDGGAPAEATEGRAVDGPARGST